jgi:hypothetical protein
VDAGGRVTHRLPVRDPGRGQPIPPERIVADVALPRSTARDPTPYARGGWLLTPLSQLLVLLALARVGVTRYRRRANAPGR